MAFATIEDIQGEIDLVIFPRTYAKYQQLIQWDNIIMVDGKVDNRGAEPKVLVDRITTEFDQITPLETFGTRKPVPSQRPLKPSVSKPAPSPGVAKPDHALEPDSLMEDDLLVGFVTDLENKLIPPPPEESPFGWDDKATTQEPTVLESRSESIRNPQGTESQPMAIVDDESPEAEGLDQENISESDPMIKETIPSAVSSPIRAEEVEEEDQSLPLAPVEISEKVLKPILPPMRPGGSEDIQMITIILRPRHDKTRDKLLLRRIFGMLICRPGVDRFAFQIFEHGKGHLLEFPNLTTGICKDLIAQIAELVGTDNVRIEPITFQ